MSSGRKTAYVDYQQRASEFAVGDIVYPFITGNPAINGRVVAVYPAIGMVDVEWPYGSERMAVEDVQQYFNQAGDFNPPNVKHDNVPGGAAKAPVGGGPVAPVDQAPLQKRGGVSLPKQEGKVVGTVAAFTALREQRAAAANIPLAAIHVHPAEVNLSATRVAKAYVKQALYWGGKDRKYRASQEELDSGNFRCPRCENEYLRPANYKKENGGNVRLLACGKCLFLIRPCDMIGHAEFIQPAATPFADRRVEG